MNQPLKPPFTWFGNKRTQAATIWTALGNPAHYTEPFAGTAATLLARPHPPRHETINDLDPWVANCWRSIQQTPDLVADHLTCPTTEIDLTARKAWLKTHTTAMAAAIQTPGHHDPKAAAWWLYTINLSIAPTLDTGPWHIIDGHLRRTTSSPTGITRRLPRLGGGGNGHARDLTHYSQDPHKALRTYLRALSTRITSTRITSTDWQQAIPPTTTTDVGILLDPPYDTHEHLYQQNNTISAQVRAWCLTAPPHWRITLAGYQTEHDQLLDHGWTKTQPPNAGRGYNKNPTAGDRERLWLSPACHPTNPTTQLHLL